MRKLSRKGIVKKLDKVFSLFIRNRFAKNGIAQCVTCGKKDAVERMQAGHFISRKHYATRWCTTNVQVQCASCNVFKYGEQYKFGVYLDQHYGVGTADELLQKSKQIVKLTNEELLEKVELYKVP
tara:strand:- start:1402 stop:1776 length:375 start_codon:yes stop_codon:yes gene_type:complete